LNPKHVDALLIKSVFLTEAPAFIGGDRRKAVQVADEMPRIQAEHGYLNLARFAKAEKNYGKMENAYQKALAANPRSYRAVYGLANLYCCVIPSPNWDAADQRAREAIALDPTRVGGYAVLAATLAHAQRWADLDALMVQSEKSVPDDLSPYYFAAKVLRETGADTPRAERYLQKYMSEEPEGETPTLSFARWQLALVYEKQGRKAEAVKLMQTVVAALPGLDEPKRDLKRMK
jgi:tetratricopeptide (TPR) repeat protein